MLPNILLIVISSVISLIGFSQEFSVEHYGALKNFMHKNDLSAKVSLSDFEGLEHTYALGALENLQGEILILNQEAYISTIKDNQCIIDTTFQQKASLLVSAQVKKWESIPLKGRLNKAKLEKEIEHAAQKAGLDIEMPFPFRLEGTVERLQWHVIQWDLSDSVHTHQKHVESGINGEINQQDVEILGFYSKHHHAVFTHHSTNMHLHFITDDVKLAGHVDDITMKAKVTLFLPEL